MLLVDIQDVFVNFLELLQPGIQPRVVNDILSFTSTFRGLLSQSERDFEDYVKTTLTNNSARANNAKILIDTNLQMGIKDISFKL